MKKYIIQRFRKRIDKQACPFCGCTKRVFINHHVEYPEIWWENCCDNCGKTLEYQDNCLPQNIFDSIPKGVKSKRKILESIKRFYHTL